MKATLKIFFAVLTIGFALSFASCSDDDFSDSIFDTTEYPLDRSAYSFPLDTFVKVNFLEPYNLKYMYRMEDIGSNMNYNLVPCSYDKSVTLAVLCKYLWYDVYKNNVGEEFLKTYSPRIIHVIGSPAYNPSSGTMVLGTAEGGLKITLYNGNNLEANDIDNLNEYFFKTMHHEFSHILHQNINIPTSFALISNGKYNAVSWNDTPDSVALGQGFTTPYASSAVREDWVETIANYIVKDTIYWNQMMETAAYDWETATDVDAAYWTKLDALCKAGKANRDSVGYFVSVSSSSSGEDATYKVQRKLIQRDADKKYAVPDADGNIVYLKESGIDGKAVLQQKLSMVKEWLMTNFNYDLDAVRMGVQKRQWLTDANGNFVFDANGNFINNLTYQRADGTTVLQELLQEVEKYKALQTTK